MKRALTILAALLMVGIGGCRTGAGAQSSGDTKILFMNGSPNADGNTASLARTLLQGRAYETLMLTDLRINAYGQELPGDQLDTVIAKMRTADIVVVGSPVYWHNICASVRTVMERFYGFIDRGAFGGKKLFFLYQGEAPTQKMIDDGEYSMSRFAKMYGFAYEGMATNTSQAEALRRKL